MPEEIELELENVEYKFLSKEDRKLLKGLGVLEELFPESVDDDELD